MVGANNHSPLLNINDAYGHNIHSISRRGGFQTRPLPITRLSLDWMTRPQQLPTANSV